MSSTFGNVLHLSIFGQSHSPAIGCSLDGIPAGIAVDQEKLQAFLDRRAPGRDETATKRREADAAHIIAGVIDGHTTGAPIAAIIENTNTRSNDYTELRRKPRPGHADFPARVKYHNMHDVAGGGHFSGRVTAALTAAGALCQSILAAKGVILATHIARVAGACDAPLAFEESALRAQLEALEQNTGFPVLDEAAGARGIRQRVLLRVPPGIDPHTLQAINTGRIDCQFGVPIETGQAARFVADALGRKNLIVEGFHSHIGSQIFEAEPFCDAVDILLDFAQAMRQAHGFVAETLNLGGGFGVRYLESDPVVDIPGNIRALAQHLRQGCAEKDYPVPKVLLEPGRSIVANAGLTLYRVGGIKTIEGYRSYVTVNGGMTDNPRYALYQSRYTVYHAHKSGSMERFDVVGRCCESGDIIQPGVELPGDTCRGDILAVCTTGAYNYSMASNYNRLPRPAVVMLTPDRIYEAVRRETFADLTGLDL